MITFNPNTPANDASATVSSDPGIWVQLKTTTYQPMASLRRQIDEMTPSHQVMVERSKKMKPDFSWYPAQGE